MSLKSRAELKKLLGERVYHNKNIEILLKLDSRAQMPAFWHQDHVSSTYRTNPLLKIRFGQNFLNSSGSNPAPVVNFWNKNYLERMFCFGKIFFEKYSSSFEKNCIFLFLINSNKIYSICSTQALRTKRYVWEEMG